MVQLKDFPISSLILKIYISPIVFDNPQKITPSLRKVFFEFYPPSDIPQAIRGACGYFFLMCVMTKLRSSVFVALYVLGV